MARSNIIIIAIVVTVVIVAGLWRVSEARNFQFFGEIVARVETADSVVALTFDDGPTRRYTEDVLRILRERGARATFFVTGRETSANPAEARQIVAEGHELGNHSYSHGRMIFMTPGRIRREVEDTDAAIRGAGERGDIYFRPPYGQAFPPSLVPGPDRTNDDHVGRRTGVLSGRCGRCRSYCRPRRRASAAGLHHSSAPDVREPA